MLHRKGEKNEQICHWKDRNLPLKRQTKIAADDILISLLLSSKKIRLDFLCESSARQRIHLKTSSLIFSEKQFMNVVCCSRDWRFKG